MLFGLPICQETMKLPLRLWRDMHKLSWKKAMLPTFPQVRPHILNWRRWQFPGKFSKC